MLKQVKASKILIIALLLLTAPSHAAIKCTGGANSLWDSTDIIDTAKNNHSIYVSFIPYDVDHTTSSTWGQVILFVGKNGLMSISLSTTGYPRFRWYRTSAWETATAASAISDNQPYSVLGTWSKGASSYIYVNGVQSSPVTASNIALNSGGGAYYNCICDYCTTTSGLTCASDDIAFRGIVSEACVWNDIALSAQDAINLSSKVVASCRDIHPENLTAYWPLDEYPDGTDVDGYYYDSQDPIHAGSTSANMLVEGNGYIQAAAEPQLTHK